MNLEVEVRVRVSDEPAGVSIAEVAVTEEVAVDARGVRFWLEFAAGRALHRVADATVRAVP